MTNKHRKRFACNRCLKLQYPIVRTLYVAMWLYYIPFSAITVNFTLPFARKKYTEWFGEGEIPEAGEMSGEYEEWIANQLAQAADSNYNEPSTEKLVAMMEKIPAPMEGWVTHPAISVTPMSLENYWDCFWSNEAPYFLPSIIRDAEDVFELAVAWNDPESGYETQSIDGVNDIEVIQERRVEKRVRIR